LRARNQPVSFRFNHRQLTGEPGDTLAAALLANGVRIVGRSFKFHRPRGIYSCGVEEPNALVQLGSGAHAVPCTRATLVEIHEGLEAFSETGWPSVTFDAGRLLDFAAPLWAAGFYNKTFMWPSWHTYEGIIRRLAGAGRSPVERDPDRYDPRNLHCDVLVIGGGEAGLRAATIASRAGSRVVLVEQRPTLGGRCAWDSTIVDGKPGAAWVAATEQALMRAPDVRILRRTTAVGFYDRDVVTMVESVPRRDGRSTLPRERFWIVRAKRVVLATGTIEQPLIFSNNDRPGVMLAGAANEYLRRYSVPPGRRVVVATNNDSAYALARALRSKGVEVVALADSRADVSAALVSEMRALRIRLIAGSIPIDTRGFNGVCSVTIARLSRDARKTEGTHQLDCDTLCVSGGWNPALHLYAQAGGKLVYSEHTGALEASGAHPIITVATASKHQGLGVRISPVGNPLRQWVDLRHDVTVADLQLAIRENYRSVEHVKRYTTLGMSLDQGKTANVLGLEILAGLRGVKPSELGHTTLRPPFTPVTLGAIAGRAIGERFAPGRLLPMHNRHLALKAVMEDFGAWKRPAVYRRQGESRADAVRSEAQAVRAAAGLFDASPLGKIEIQGPDALAFLDRFYINPLTTLQPGRARYGLMLRDSGILFDDGIVTSLDRDHYLITTTSANADRVAGWLEEWHQCEWPQLRVVITAVTEQWATLSLTGPRAREILSRLGPTIDLSNDAFPHMSVREGQLMDQPVRIYRVSFTGELTFEINVPANFGVALWDALMEAGTPLGLKPLGLDALQLLRLEKGFLHIGTDTDGTTVPDDVGWGAVAANKTSDYIGKRALRLPDHVRPDRLQLVGLTADKQTDLIAGSHVRFSGSTEATDGWITSAGRSVMWGEPLALARIRGGRQRIGEQVSVHESGRVSYANIVKPVFYDPAGERMHG
jgi:sarcosine oxidase subunit alpha